MYLFAIASLAPIPFLWGAAMFGGWLTVLALIVITVGVMALDEGVARSGPEGSEEDIEWADALSMLLAQVHFITLALVVYSLAKGDWAIWEKIFLFFAAGQYFGQVSNSNAHELIHRSTRLLNWLGRLVFISLLFGHHASAHPLVHHRFVATDDDPNSARIGESFYHFAKRAWKGSFLKGLAAESERRARAGKSRLTHPYVGYIGGALAFAIGAVLIGGPAGLFWYVLLAGNAQMQLLLSDYVQHYGLRRAEIDGKHEPVGPQHSWNSPHWFSSALMLNAPRHSDHHAHPATPYPLLRLGDVPMLPRSLPFMATLALSPKRWRRVMDPLVQDWTRA